MIPTALLSHWATTSFRPRVAKLVRIAANRNRGATVFAYQVQDPERYGVVSFDAAGTASHITEKPKSTKSNWAITGLYFFDNDVVRYAAELKPSRRGELEITDLQKCYLGVGKLHVEKMGRGFAWLDTGTFESLIEAATFVQTLEKTPRHENRLSRGNCLSNELY